ncbi:MAG: DUF3667 domain-containing protein [Holophagales bacterium]|nr:DUF3667 domain-containing protein [Holophagales bacterium]MYG29461.1 DUF3667 domain-containing protein [Holophagales bacterium]MYI80021.1 DUF3667 domain-containing protein [Holophagales bacterium]
MAKIPGEDVVIRSVESALEGKAADIARCPNCGSDQVDSYCAACGQRAGDLHTSVGHFIRDAMDGLFSFDSRVWRTLIALVFRPGLLTVEYWQGRRARYVAPLRLYLFVSFFTFLLLALFARGNVVDMTGEDRDAPVRITLTESEIAEEDAGWFVDRVLRPIMEDTEGFEALFVRRLPWMFFALVPLFAVLLRLLYRRRELFYVPHLVFALHFHAAAFLVFVAGRAGALLWEPVSSFAFLAILVALFLSLRRSFNEGWFRTVVKEAVLLLVHGLAITMATLVLMISTSLSL